jgi:hypothetical protein
VDTGACARSHVYAVNAMIEPKRTRYTKAAIDSPENAETSAWPNSPMRAPTTMSDIPPAIISMPVERSPERGSGACRA